MGYTYTQVIDANPPDEAIIAQSFSTEITVYEDAGATSSGFTVREPNSSSPAITVPAGNSHTFRGHFPKGQRVGYVAALSGSLTLAQVEK